MDSLSYCCLWVSNPAKIQNSNQKPWDNLQLHAIDLISKVQLDLFLNSEWEAASGSVEVLIGSCVGDSVGSRMI